MPSNVLNFELIWKMFSNIKLPFYVYMNSHYNHKTLTTVLVFFKQYEYLYQGNGLHIKTEHDPITVLMVGRPL